MDFLVWQGYPPTWVMGLTLRQFLAFLDAASRRTACLSPSDGRQALAGKALASGLLTGKT